MVVVTVADTAAVTVVGLAGLVTRVDSPVRRINSRIFLCSLLSCLYPLDLDGLKTRPHGEPLPVHHRLTHHDQAIASRLHLSQLQCPWCVVSRLPACFPSLCPQLSWFRGRPLEAGLSSQPRPFTFIWWQILLLRSSRCPCTQLSCWHDVRRSWPWDVCAGDTWYGTTHSCTRTWTHGRLRHASSRWLHGSRHTAVHDAVSTAAVRTTVRPRWRRWLLRCCWWLSWLQITWWLSPRDGFVFRARLKLGFSFPLVDSVTVAVIAGGLPGVDESLPLCDSCSFVSLCAVECTCFGGAGSVVVDFSFHKLPVSWFSPLHLHGVLGLDTRPRVTAVCLGFHVSCPQYSLG
jgi:hypothetical protein